MRWGVRRYQPYSTTGPRKSGKAGKEIGAAAKLKKNMQTLKKITDNYYNKELSKYRNADGTLTDLGRKAYYQDSKIYQKDKRKLSEAELNKYGVRSAVKDSSGTLVYYIDKGSEMQRITNKNEALSNRRKYVSITDDDNQAYEEVFDQLDFDPYSKKNPKDNAVRVDTYEATKKLKMASAKRVVEHMLKEYGDQTVEELVSKDIGKYSEAYEAAIKRVIKQEGNTKIKNIILNQWDYSYGYNGSTKIDAEKGDFATKFSATRYDAAIMATRKFVQQLSANQKNGNSKISKKVFDDFAKMGYDAIVDAEDARYFDMPIILLNPVESVKRKHTEIW